MKKRYMIPEVLVTRIVTDFHFCNGSPNDTTPTEGLDDDPLTPGGDDPGNFSRRRNQWDAIEEEEEFEEEDW